MDINGWYKPSVGPGRTIWNSARFDLDLSLVARLGGHSQPRTHRGKERFPGMTITYVPGTSWGRDHSNLNSTRLQRSSGLRWIILLWPSGHAGRRTWKWKCFGIFLWFFGPLRLVLPDYSTLPARISLHSQDVAIETSVPRLDQQISKFEGLPPKSSTTWQILENHSSKSINHL